MKKTLIFLILIVLCALVGLYATANKPLPPLQNGDLIFQTSSSNQASAILVASASPYTHMGIIKKNGENIVVIEAVQTVRETPLAEWVNRGMFKRIAVFRYRDLNTKQAATILSDIKKLYGKPYDIFFSFNNNAIYCSELPFLGYKAAGISLGRIQKVIDLNFDNILVRKLIKQRWERHTECKTKGYNFEKCYNHILHQELITPASIARDERLEKIHTNYPL